MLINSLFLQDSSGIFWDNDSLAGLLAIELKADLLVLLSDVDGLYNGPPSEPQSKIIHTYIKEKHHNEITFGDKSRVGRGGMTAKVKAAFVASNSGTPVVITRYVLRLPFFSKRMMTTFVTHLYIPHVIYQNTHVTCN
jgi:glutamate 5-kinase